MNWHFTIQPPGVPRCSVLFLVTSSHTCSQCYQSHMFSVNLHLQLMHLQLIKICRNLIWSHSLIYCYCWMQLFVQFIIAEQQQQWVCAFQTHLLWVLSPYLLWWSAVDWLLEQNVFRTSLYITCWWDIVFHCYTIST